MNRNKTGQARERLLLIQRERAPPGSQKQRQFFFRVSTVSFSLNSFFNFQKKTITTGQMGTPMMAWHMDRQNRLRQQAAIAQLIAGSAAPQQQSVGAEVGPYIIAFIFGTFLSFFC